MYHGGLNGVSLSGKTNTMSLMDHHHMTHSSPQGPPSSTITASAAAMNDNTNNSNGNMGNGNHVAYSSSTGSHSLSGTSAGTPGSMLLANTMMQVLPPDGSGYPLLKPNGHHHHLQSPPVSQAPSLPPPQHNAYDPYNTNHMGNGGVNGGAGIMYMPNYHDFRA